MATDMLELLRGAEVFEGLDDAELAQVAHICREAQYRKGDLLTSQGEEGHELYIVQDGLVEITVNDGHEPTPRTLINMGAGQVVGEMALVDRGPRSATVRCVAPATVSVIEREAFEQLCDSNHHIGMLVYRNLAADLSFKLRHRHLARR